MKDDETNRERRCWYLIAQITDTDFDEQVAPHLYPKGYDKTLSAPTKKLDALIARLAKRYDTGIACETEPIERPLDERDFLRERYCPDARTYLLSYSDDDREARLWKKSVVHEQE